MEDMKGGMNGGKCEHCGGNHSCCHGGGMMGMGQRHGGRVLLKIIVLLIVFWMGVQLGELKAYAHGGMMGGYGYGGYGYDAGYGPDNGSYGPGMMYRVISGQSTTTVR